MLLFFPNPISVFLYPAKGPIKGSIKNHSKIKGDSPVKLVFSMFRLAKSSLHRYGKAEQFCNLLFTNMKISMPEEVSIKSDSAYLVILSVMAVSDDLIHAYLISEVAQ